MRLGPWWVQRHRQCIDKAVQSVRTASLSGAVYRWEIDLAPRAEVPLRFDRGVSDISANPDDALVGGPDEWLLLNESGEAVTVTIVAASCDLMADVVSNARVPVCAAVERLAHTLMHSDGMSRGLLASELRIIADRLEAGE